MRAATQLVQLTCHVDVHHCAQCHPNYQREPQVQPLIYSLNLLLNIYGSLAVRSADDYNHRPWSYSASVNWKVKTLDWENVEA